MSKEYLEALNGLFDLIHCQESFEKAQKYFDIIEEALKRLEAIEKGKNTDIIDNYMAFKNDNANPSEALECVEQIGRELKIYYEHLYIILRDSKKELISNMKKVNEYLETIKQALLKAQKEHNSINLLMQELDCKDFAELRKYARCGYEKLNKKYLKWEDLEFNHTPKMIDVKMSGNKYKLVVGYNVAGKNLAILRDGKKEYYFLECDKQFFNNLHLEVVE